MRRLFTPFVLALTAVGSLSLAAEPQGPSAGAAPPAKAAPPLGAVLEPPQYSVTELKPLTGYPHAYPLAVNASGISAGYVMNASKTVARAVRWDAQGNPNLVGPGQAAQSKAVAVRADGTTAGWAKLTSGTYLGFFGSGTLPGFVILGASENRVAGYVTNGSTWVGRIHPPGAGAPAMLPFVTVSGINDDGVWVGTKTPNPANVGTMMVAGPFPAAIPGALYAINASKLAVGQIGLGPAARAVKWDRSKTVMPEHLGALGGTSGVASDVNAGGWIVGRADDASGADNAFVHCYGKMFNLNEYVDDGGADPAPSPRLPTGGGGASLASGTPLTKVTNDWFLMAATGINADGVIVGFGRKNDGPEDRGFLLRKKTTNIRVLKIDLAATRARVLAKGGSARAVDLASARAPLDLPAGLRAEPEPASAPATAPAAPAAGPRAAPIGK